MIRGGSASAAATVGTPVAARAIDHVVDAVESLMAMRNNGRLSYRVGVMMWNAERVLQALLLLEGEKVHGKTVTVQFPRAVLPAKAVPDKAARDRMRRRIVLQLRRLVSRHFVELRHSVGLFRGFDRLRRVRGVPSVEAVDIDDINPEVIAPQDASDEEVATGAVLGAANMLPFNEIKSELWLSPVANSDEDIIDYVRNLEGWEEKAAKWAKPNDEVAQGMLLPKIRNDTALQAKKIRDTMAHYEDPSLTARAWDEETRNIQLENNVKAKQYNDITRESFVASTVLACAMAMAVIEIPNVRIGAVDEPNGLYNADNENAEDPGKKPPPIEEVDRILEEAYKAAMANRIRQKKTYVKRREEAKAAYPDLVPFMTQEVTPENAEPVTEGWWDWLAGMVWQRRAPPPAAAPPAALVDTYAGGKRADINATLDTMKSGIDKLGANPEPWARAVSLVEVCLVFSAVR